MSPELLYKTQEKVYYQMYNILSFLSLIHFGIFFANKSPAASRKMEIVVGV